MTRRRAWLAPIAMAWLSCQLTSLAATPVALWVGASRAGAVECRCSHGADATCPMHRAPARGPRVCVMQAAGEWTTEAVASMFGLVAPPGGGFALDDLLAVARVDLVTVTPVSPFSVSPDPPPPRR